VGLTMARGDQISTYEARARAELPFLAAGTGVAA